jgi:capsular polysaccharide transport system permease protein
LHKNIGIPRSLNIPEAFCSALNAGELDSCLIHLARRDADSDAGLRCLLAEALLHRGRRDEAVQCCRRALPLIGGDAAMLHRCAWVFSNCECHGEAAAAYRSLIAICPDWIDGYRHLSGSLAAIGEIDDAIRLGRRASDLAPDNGEFARHAGHLLLGARRYDLAADYLGRAIASSPDDGLALCALAAAFCELDRGEEAAALASRAAELSRGDTEIAVYAAELLLRCNRADDAAELLDSTAGAAADDRLWRVLSAAEMVRGRLEAALSAVDRALAGAPDNAEYHLHRGHLLWRLGDSGAAAMSFDRAARLDPANRDVKRAQLSFYLAAGLVTEATTVGGELLHRFPDDKPSAEAVLHLLTHRLDAIDGEYVVLSRGAERAPRPVRPPPRWLDRLRSQRRVVRALVMRETRTRFADLKLGYAWALIEPVLHIALLSVMFAVLMHGQPPIGKHFFIFYYTGLVPYHMFVHTSTGMSHAITGNGAVLQLPPVTTFDVVAARGLLEIMTDVIVAVMLLAGFAAIGLAAMPDDLWGPSMALLVTAALGVGCGFVNAVLTVFWPSWDRAYGQLTRILYFISGIFYVPGMMPDWARDALAWNPVLQAIDWFRAGFFASYQPHWLDRSYLVALAILALLAGLTLERGLRRRLSAPA